MDKLIQPKKSLGQHFLKSIPYCRKIVEFSSLQKNEVVVEIGPGTGQLTQILLQTASHVIAIEIDKEMLDALRKRFSQEPETESRLILLEADILHFQWKIIFDCLKNHPAAGARQEPLIRVIGNLPYNISTRIISSMTGLPFRFQSFTFMTQKEVADRILARPGTEDYGYFSILMDYHFHRLKGFDVPPGAFHPPPKVTSSVFTLLPRKEAPFLSGSQYRHFQKFLQTAFRHRRKKLKNNLKKLVTPSNQLEALFRDAEIDPNARPQDVKLEQYLLMIRMLCCEDESEY